jgi:thioredoxin-related protein
MTAETPPEAAPPHSILARKPIVPLLLLAAMLVIVFVTSRPAPEPPGWQSDFDAATATARAEGKPMLVAFTSPGCPPCESMKRTVLVAPRVQAKLREMVPVNVDTYERTDLARRFGIPGTPTYIVLSPEGRERARLSGMHTEAEFLALLKR